MREEFGLHELAVEDARNGHQRPKIEEYGDSLFAVLQTVELVNDAASEISSSARSTSSSAPTTSCRCACARERGFADVRARSEREPELLKHGAAYVFYALMDKVVDRYFPVLDGARNRARSDRGADLRRAMPRAPTSRRCTR